MRNLTKRLLAAGAAMLFAAPTAALACACGCGVFDVGAGVLEAMPEGENGLSVWFRYSTMDQNRNWEHGASAPASDNSDKEINTSFYTVGAEYMVNDDWLVMAELPVYARLLTTTDDGTVFGPAGSVYTAHLTDLGDLQLSAAYTGFSPDMSSGLTFGVKLPTGNDTGPTGPLGGSEFDRDSLPGTGSTDLMVGGFHTGDLNSDGSLRYFLQAKVQFAVLTRDAYRPGNELDGAVGVTYDFGKAGPFDDVAPILQLIGSTRDRDSGANADPLNSGYQRLLLAPGFEAQFGSFRLYADVELPLTQYTNAAASLAIEGTSGQLVAPALFKTQLAYDF
jgi:hypothetical protein